MSNETEFRPYETLLEQLGKLVGIFGLFLALSFLYGYFYQLFFFAKFDSGWLISLYPLEAVIAIGVPWTIFIAAVASIFYLAFPALESLRKGMRLLLLGAGIVGFGLSLGLQKVGFKIGESPIFWILEFGFYIVCAGGIIPSALRKYREKHSPADVAIEFMIGVGLLCVFVPFMMASSKALDVRLFFPGVPLFEVDGKVTGVLLGNVEEKYIVMSCDDFRTVSLYEHSDDYSIVARSSVDECKPVSNAGSAAPAPK